MVVSRRMVGRKSSYHTARAGVTRACEIRHDVSCKPPPPSIDSCRVMAAAAAAGWLANFSGAGALVAQGPVAAWGELISPTLVLVLCVIAGIGTVLMLPARRDVTFRKIGAAVLIAAGLIFAAMLVHNVANAPGGGHMSIYFWVF